MLVRIRTWRVQLWINNKIRSSRTFCYLVISTVLESMADFFYMHWMKCTMALILKYINILKFLRDGFDGPMCGDAMALLW
jgi:hypothetical protein